MEGHARGTRVNTTEAAVSGRRLLVSCWCRKPVRDLQLHWVQGRALRRLTYIAESGRAEGRRQVL